MTETASMEDAILAGLIFNEEYARKVISHLKEEYFTDNVKKSIFKTIDEYVKKYNSCPTPESIKIELGESTGLSESSYYDAIETVSKMSYDPKTNLKWLVDGTEQYCKDRASFNAVLAAAAILDGSDKERGPNAIPKMLQDALSVSFDLSVGHDYFDNAVDQFDFYHKKEDKIPFDLHYFNEITKGGLSRKTLTVILAGTGIGKSFTMCHFAAANLTQGKNVLYITLEMSEERIRERIDMNLLDVTGEELLSMTRETYLKRVEAVHKRTLGKLKIKAYPTASVGSATFRALLEELRTKQDFSPDIIYVDYLNICISSRIRMGSNVNSYTYVKAIAEELRGLAVEYDVPIVTATQTNRDGFSSSDVGLENTSESFGLPATADLMFALISNEDMEALGQLLVKQLKNRYSDLNRYRKFVVGIDRSRMKFFDAEDSAQDGIMDGPRGFGIKQPDPSDKFKGLT